MNTYEVPDVDFPNVLRFLMYLDGRDHTRTFRNLVIQHTAVVILTRVDAMEKSSGFFPRHICKLPTSLMTPKINSFGVNFAHKCVYIYIYWWKISNIWEQL